MTETAESRSARPLAVVILAAGAGTRMRSDRPKVLHQIAGLSMLGHVIGAARALAPARLVVVTGHGAEAVGAEARASAGDVALTVCHQAEQRGTGHAVLAAAPGLDGFEGDVLVLYGDTPLLRSETLARLVAAEGALRVLGFETNAPAGYGRLVIGAEGLERIVEANDATPEEQAITACNSGVMAADAGVLLGLLAKVEPANAQGEYYLTDTVALARAQGMAVSAVMGSEAEMQGVNDRVQLAAAETIWQAGAREAAMRAGATMRDPASVFLAHDTTIGRDVEIGPNTVFGPGVVLEDGARVEAFCHLEQCRIGSGASVGPFARLRGGAVVGSDCRIGNFVEAKNTIFAPGAKAAHLSYVGDAEIGAGANLGAGTITCNYDGFTKHRTEIGAGAFIGTNTALIAPITVGPGAYVATGSVLTEDVPGDALALARTRQVTKPGRAARLRALLSARKKGA
ncbi:MAG: bifunctional UDP-N-acetylglucosamine diphosphorylase/glucosamine-1-phosphate N-acetyltransferase GlmU [Pseudomonadota bacterium]